MSKMLIYHICRRQDWQNALEMGLYHGSVDDRTDGFLHFSTAQQVAESAGRHKAKVVDLMLITVDANDFGSDLKWELSRGGQLFPHLYGSLSISKVLSVCDLPLAEDGFHQFPDGIVPWRPPRGESSNV